MAPFLVDPGELARPLPDVGIQPALPHCAADDAVRAVAPGHSGEPLVAVAAVLATFPVYREPGFGFTSVPLDLLLRGEVADRLAAASRSLPAGFDLVVLDGWRPVRFQAELLDYYSGRYDSPLHGYVSDPRDQRLVPPHTTGGAVDLTLRFDGTPLALGTDFDDFSPDAHLDALEGRDGSEVNAALRRLLARVLVAQEFAPYPLEWWHWSFGDQRWAAQYGHGQARYGIADPPG